MIKPSFAILFAFLIIISCSSQKGPYDPVLLDVNSTREQLLSEANAEDTLVIYSNGGANCPSNYGGSIWVFRKSGYHTSAIRYGNYNQIDIVNHPWNFPWRYLSEQWEDLENDTTDYSFPEWSHYWYNDVYVQLGSETMTWNIEMSQWHANKNTPKVIFNEKIQAMLYRAGQ